MREENHQLYKIAAKTKISIQWDDSLIPTIRGKRGLKYPSDRRSQVNLVIEPHDNEFSDMLSAQGINTKAPVDQSLITPMPTDPMEKLQTDLESMLNLRPELQKE
jgi:hypothetical protein